MKLHGIEIEEFMTVRLMDGGLFMFINGIFIKCGSKPPVRMWCEEFSEHSVRSIHPKHVSRHKAVKQLHANEPYTEPIFDAGNYEGRQERAGFKVGDFVEIYQKDIPKDWPNLWYDSEARVGKKGYIRAIGPAGIAVEGMAYPYTCLRKVDAIEMTTAALEYKLGYPVKIIPDDKGQRSYLERQAECGLEVGDFVEVYRRDIPDDWPNFWPEKGEAKVGNRGRVQSIDRFGVEVFGQYYPYNCLRKVEPCKVTVAELEKELGFPVKVVKEEIE